MSKSDPLRGAVAGLVSGLVASLAMELAQKALSRLQSSSDDDSEPATEQAADRVSQATLGAPVGDERKPLAGEAVHYGFGALLGLGYGIAAEYWPQTTAGWGSAFGIGNAVLFDEMAVPAAGLGKSPFATPASTHLYSVASHLVFGAAAESTRRLVRAAI